MAFESSSKAPQVIHSIIPCLVFRCGTLVCLLFLKHKDFEKISNVFLLLLALVSSWLRLVSTPFAYLDISDLLLQPGGSLTNHWFYLRWAIPGLIFIYFVFTYKRWGAVFRPREFTTKFNNEHFFGVFVVIYLAYLCSSLPKPCLTQVFPVIFSVRGRLFQIPKVQHVKYTSPLGW